MKTHYMKLTAFMAVMLSCVTAMAAVGQHPSLAKVLVKGVADSLSITNTSIAFYPQIQQLPTYFKNFKDGDIFIRHNYSAPMVDLI